MSPACGRDGVARVKPKSSVASGSAIGSTFTVAPVEETSGHEALPLQ